MPSRPLVWLTVFFMLGISADRFLGDALPLPVSCLALAALALIAAMAARLMKAKVAPPRFTDSPTHQFTH